MAARKVRGRTPSKRTMRPRAMEPLWSRAGATSGNRWQMERPRNPLEQADPQPLATHGNGSGAHGKEGVNGSSPLEGFAKVPANRHFSSSTHATRGYVAGTSL